MLFRDNREIVEFAFFSFLARTIFRHTLSIVFLLPGYSKAGGGRRRTLSARKCQRVAHCDRPRLKAIVSALAPLQIER